MEKLLFYVFFILKQPKLFVCYTRKILYILIIMSDNKFSLRIR